MSLRNLPVQHEIYRSRSVGPVPISTTATPLLNFTKVISLSGGRTTPLLNFTKVIFLSGGRTTLSFLNNYLTKTGIIIQLPKIDTFLLLLSHRVIFCQYQRKTDSENENCQ